MGVTWIRRNQLFMTPKMMQKLVGQHILQAEVQLFVFAQFFALLFHTWEIIQYSAHFMVQLPLPDLL